MGNKAESHRQTNALRSTKLSANPITSESEYIKGWTNEESWFCYRQRQEYCSSPVRQACSGAHPISCSLANGGKRPRNEADRSSQSSAEVKSAWSYISTHPQTFIYCTRTVPFPSICMAHFATPCFASYIMIDITFAYICNASSPQFSSWKLLVHRIAIISS